MRRSFCGPRPSVSNVDTAFTFVAGPRLEALLPSLDSLCWWRTSAPAWARKSAPPALLYGMGRSKASPNLSSAWSIPATCAAQQRVLCRAIALAGALLVKHRPLQLRLGAEMLNFGALIAFMA